VATFDLNILPIHRYNGQDFADLPGLLAVTPPRKTARGRDRDSLIVHLTLAGNARLEAHEIEELTRNAAAQFYQSSGSLTSAMRKAAEGINNSLLERNLSTTGRGQYALGLLVLAAIRENQCTLLFSGPTHAVWVSEGTSRHIHDPALSGKGLGSSQSIQTYFSQVELHSQDLVVLCGKFPRDWEADLLGERPPTSLDASYRKLTLTKGDLNAVLIQTPSGQGVITILRPDVSAARHARQNIAPVMGEPIAPETSETRTREESPIPDYQSPITNLESPIISSSIIEEELDSLADFGAHYVQPSAYAIPPQPESIAPPRKETPVSGSRVFPPSIPRAKPPQSKNEAISEIERQAEYEAPLDVKPDSASAESPPHFVGRSKPGAHTEATRQMAKVVAGGIQSGRRVNERLGAFMQRFIPRLLPNADSIQPYIVPTYAMVFMTVVIPVLVVTIATVVYLRFGQSVQYDDYYSQAVQARAQATSETDPVRQRDAWSRVLNLVDQAEQYRETDESKFLRTEAQANLDNLMGVVRLEFVPAFTGGLGGSTQISRLAASESDLYMLDAERGDILHAAFTGRSLELDNTFDCKPGIYGGHQVGALVDILALPKVNALGASVLGVDAKGNLLYCASGQVPQVIPLPALPNTNWSRITAFVLDGGRLYVLDAEARAVWVFVGKDSSFTDPPYFYFGNQIPQIENAIDLGVSGDDLYLLHADGHLSTCTFSRIPDAPTRCIDPAPRVDNIAAHRDLDVFAQANFTQMTLTNPPNMVILLLDSENQSVFRLTPRSFELQNQITGFAGKASPFQRGPVGAMAVSPSYVLYLAIGDQVYFATNLP
jgi:hypothetical protein